MLLKRYLTPWHEYYEELLRSKLDWSTDAPCRAQGPNRMYPPSQKGQKAVAEDVCGGCSARIQCLNLALVNKEDNGVWGGTTEAQRKVLYDELLENFDITDKTIWKDENVKDAVLNKAIEFTMTSDIKTEEIKVKYADATKYSNEGST